jgi:hypothetical protein
MRWRVLTAAALFGFSVLTIGGSAQAASRASATTREAKARAQGESIQPGSEWTFYIQNSVGGCGTITFQADNDFSDSLGDDGIWHGGKSSVRLVFDGGSGAPGFAPGIFTGKYYGSKTSGVFAGKFHYRIKMFDERDSSQLIPGPNRCPGND